MVTSNPATWEVSPIFQCNTPLCVTLRGYELRVRRSSDEATKLPTEHCCKECQNPRPTKNTKSVTSRFMSYMEVLGIDTHIVLASQVGRLRLIDTQKNVECVVLRLGQNKVNAEWEVGSFQWASDNPSSSGQNRNRLFQKLVLGNTVSSPYPLPLYQTCQAICKSCLGWAANIGRVAWWIFFMLFLGRFFCQNERF